MKKFLNNYCLMACDSYVFLRVRPLALYCILFFYVSFLHAQIVDDTTKRLYGTHTTQVFTQNTLYLENRVFFTKDTLYTVPFTPRKPRLTSAYSRPQLYTPLEWKIKRMQDSLQALKADSIQKVKADSLNAQKLDSLKAKRFYKVKVWVGSLLPTPTPEKLYEKRFYKNHYFTAKPDSALDDIQQYNNVYVHGNIYQNLGMLGTPSKAVFPIFNQNIGYHSGFRTMDLYFSEPLLSPYYNGRSPFTHIYYVGYPGTSEEDRIKVDINRNITRQWNVGLSYERVDSRKQIGRTSQQQNALLLGQEFRVYTSGRSKSERYHFMGNFTYFAYKVNEQGGLVPENTARIATEDNTLPQNEAPADFAGWPVWLNAPNSGYNPWSTQGNIFTRDRRVAYHFYQQFDVLKTGKLSLFHEFDRRNQKFRFADPTIAQTNLDSTFYLGQARYNDSTTFNYEFANLYNKIGLKSNVKFVTAIAYVKQRNVWAAKELTAIDFFKILSAPWQSYQTWAVNDPLTQINIRENYAGADIVLKLNDSVKIHGNVEQLIGLVNYSKNSSFRDFFDYKADFTANVSLKWHTLFEAGAGLTRASPAMFSIYSMMHNHYYWWNNFDATTTQQLYVQYNLKMKKHFFSVKPWIFSAFNPVYYQAVFNETLNQNELKALQYTANPVSYFFFDAVFTFSVWKIHVDNFLRYTHKISDENSVFRMPRMYANTKVYIKYVPSKKQFAQDFRFGFDIFYRSGYFGDAYMPAAGQFYIQNDFSLNNNILIDLYLSAKMRNARIFMKFNQFNQLLQLTNGYYITPYYPGTRASFAIGIKWYFFD